MITLKLTDDELSVVEQSLIDYSEAAQERIEDLRSSAELPDVSDETRGAWLAEAEALERDIEIAGRLITEIGGGS